VRRLLDVKHHSRLDMLDRALHALGRQMVLVSVSGAILLGIRFPSFLGYLRGGRGQVPLHIPPNLSGFTNQYECYWTIEKEKSLINKALVDKFRCYWI
jgi:hypothetical protein